MAKWFNEAPQKEYDESNTKWFLMAGNKGKDEVVPQDLDTYLARLFQADFSLQQAYYALTWERSAGYDPEMVMDAVDRTGRKDELLHNVAKRDTDIAKELFNLRSDFFVEEDQKTIVRYAKEYDLANDIHINTYSYKSADTKEEFYAEYGEWPNTPEPAAQVVESFDGGIVNTNKPITAANAHEFMQKIDSQRPDSIRDEDAGVSLKERDEEEEEDRQRSLYGE